MSWGSRTSTCSSRATCAMSGSDAMKRCIMNVGGVPSGLPLFQQASIQVKRSSAISPPVNKNGSSTYVYFLVKRLGKNYAKSKRRIAYYIKRVKHQSVLKECATIQSRTIHNFHYFYDSIDFTPRIWPGSYTITKK